MSTQADPFGIGAAQRFQLGSQTGDPTKIQHRGFLSYLVPFLQGATSTDRGMLWAGLGAVQKQRRLEDYAAYIAENERQARERLRKQEQVRALIAQQINPSLAQYMVDTGADGLPSDVVSDNLVQQGGSQYGNEAAANTYNQALRNPGQMPYIDPYVPQSQQQALFENINKAQQGYITQQATEQAYPGYMNQGAGVAGNIYGQPTQAIPPGQAAQPVTENGLSYGQLAQPGEGALQAGVTRQALPGYVQDAATLNPLFLPQVSEGTVTGGYNKGADIYGQGKGYNLDVRKQNEAERQNKESERIAWYNARSQRISATKPSGGGSRNPYTELNAQQNYAQGRIQLIDEQLKMMGATDKGVLKEGELSKPEVHDLWAQREEMMKVINPSYRTRQESFSGLGSAIGAQSTGFQTAFPGRKIPSFSEWQKGRK